MVVGPRFVARGRESSPVCGVLAEGIDGPYIMIHNDLYGRYICTTLALPAFTPSLIPPAAVAAATPIDAAPWPTTP